MSAENGPMKLVAGNSNRALAEAIAAYLATPLTKAVVRRFADIAMGQSDLLIRPRYEVEQIPSAVALVAAGLGITALPSLTLAMFSHRALAMRPLVAPVVQRRLGVLTLKERTPSAPARFLLERVSKTLAAAAMKTPAA